MRISKTFVDDLIYQTRWILYPVSLALTVAAVVYLLHITVDAALLVYHSGQFVFGVGNGDHLVIEVVRLLEKAMTEWLLVSTIMGGHQIYIRRFKKSDGPEWLDHVDVVTMKVKLGLAFVGYSSAKLLEDIINDDVSREIFIRHLVTHTTFLMTILVVALVHRCLRN